VRQVDNAVDPVRVLIFFDSERNGNEASTVRAGDLGPFPVYPAMLGQLFVVPPLNEVLQFGVERRFRRDIVQKPFESQLMFRRVHTQFHPVIDHPDELEVAIFDFAEAAKDAPVGIGLQILSDNTQWLISHLSLGNGHRKVARIYTGKRTHGLRPRLGAL
jgi:hypothetical protein